MSERESRGKGSCNQVNKEEQSSESEARLAGGHTGSGSHLSAPVPVRSRVDVTRNELEIPARERESERERKCVRKALNSETVTAAAGRIAVLSTFSAIFSWAGPASDR